MTKLVPATHPASQLPTAHVETALDPRVIESYEMAAINANLANLALGKPMTSQDRLVEGWQKATHDELMPEMLNRRGIDEWLNRHRPANAAVMLLDIKGFKHFNDTYGQEAGDDILRYVGRKFMANLRTNNEEPISDRRRSDSPAIDQLARNKLPDEAGARYGGDEFIAIINLDAVEVDKREQVMETIRERLLNFDSFSLGGQELPIEIRSVYQISDNPNDTIDTLYAQLSHDLVVAKAAEKPAA